MTVGIYDSEATITRHRDRSVTLRVTYVKWAGSTGTLDFEKMHFAATDERAWTLSYAVFTDSPTALLAEFLHYSCTVDDQH